MKVIRQTESVPFEKTAVALGNFDGLHKAHMTIIENCIDYAKSHNLKSGVLLFTEHTLSTIRKEKVDIITQEPMKLRLLEKVGLDFVYMRDFDKEFMKLSPEDFVDKLIETLHPKAVCVGYDYRFGFMAKGDVNLLAKLGEKNGFEVIIADEIDHNGVAIKSTAIRHYVADGSVWHAANLLGRPFAIEGMVEKGLQNGRKLGFPTANIAYNENTLLPHRGVYAGYTTVDGKKYKSVINIGNNPTFNAEKTTVESHILDFNEDIYNKIICVEFIKRLRGDKKFSSIDALKEQIAFDAQAARKGLK